MIEWSITYCAICRCFRGW